jgi:hypothetical protein
MVSRAKHLLVLADFSARCAGLTPANVGFDAGEAAVVRALQQQLPLELSLAALRTTFGSAPQREGRFSSVGPLRSVLLRHPAQLFPALTSPGGAWQQAAMLDDRKTLPSWCEAAAEAP